MIALGAKQARKMAKVASALPTPHQTSRDHEVVTQRLPEGDRLKRSGGIRTRHGETELEGGHDRSGWVGGDRRGTRTGGARTIVITAADPSGLHRALENGGLVVPRSVQTDDGHRSDRRVLGRGASRAHFRLEGGRGVPRGRRAARTSPRGKNGRGTQLPNRQGRDAPRGRVGASARRGEGVELGGERGRHPASGENVDIAGPVSAGKARPTSGQRRKVGA